MKLKRMSISVVFIVIALSLCLLPATAFADYDCIRCTITRVGMYPGVAGTVDGIMVRVDDEADEWTGSRTFYLHDDLGKAGLATVLTGYSMGKSLWLRLADTAGGSLITIVYINN